MSRLLIFALIYLICSEDFRFFLLPVVEFFLLSVIEFRLFPEQLLTPDFVDLGAEHDKVIAEIEPEHDQDQGGQTAVHGKTVKAVEVDGEQKKAPGSWAMKDSRLWGKALYMMATTSVSRKIR